MDSEYTVQDRVIRFLRGKLHYVPMGNLKHEENRNIKEDRLREFLAKQGYSKTIARKAITVLRREAGAVQQGLYAANKAVYGRLKYGVKVKERVEEPEQTVYFIDFAHPERNEFAVAWEVMVRSEQEKRPDLVVYLNGIAIAVLELKKSCVSVADGIRQNLTNQKQSFIGDFFTTVQFCVAANESEGMRYGTLLTPEKHYMRWQSDHYQEHMDEQDPVEVRIEQAAGKLTGEYEPQLYKELYQLFDKERLLDLIGNFVVFDKGIKKVCRYNQFYGVKRAQSRLEKHENGIIWHTQGSGKTLTMVWLSQWILGTMPPARVLIVTDRDELDEQIEKTFGGMGETVIRTRSGRDLIERLNRPEDRLLCSLVHKFGRRGGEATGSDYEKYIEELKKLLPAGFQAKGDLYVFVDECHRTQSGKLHTAMEYIMPKAVFIGFTGTPLLKKDKKTSLEVFGSYIHTYKFNEAVEDKVVLDLRYEARDIPQELASSKKVDVWFAHKTRALSSRAKARLKEKWGNLQKVYGSASRLERIALDIIFTFETTTRLEEGGNALLVADSIASACKYYELFQKHKFKGCAIISSYTPQPGDLRTDTVSEDEETDTFLKYSTYLGMIGLDPEHLPEKKGEIAGRIAAFEAEAKRKFVEEPAKMKLLIVVDKMLTGFDAPPCTYLFIDKAMQDHGLFQAVCRVNRLDGEAKEFGYIIDYKHLFSELQEALDTYTSDAFAGYDKADVDGLLKDRSKAAIQYYREVLEELADLTEGVPMPRRELDYQHYFCGNGVIDETVDEAYMRLRERFYGLAARLVRAFAEAKPYLADVLPGDEVGREERCVNDYVNLKKMIGRVSGDIQDLKSYEPDMRRMIDDYINAGDAQTIGDMQDFTLLDFITGQGKILKDPKSPDSAKHGAAEGIENNLRRKIVEKRTVNPKYYAEMSEILQGLIEERRRGVEDYARLLEKYRELAGRIETPEKGSRYPEHIKGKAALRALYDELDQDEELAIAVDRAVCESHGTTGFRDDEFKQRRVKQSIYDVVGNETDTERIYKVVAAQTGDYQ